MKSAVIAPIASIALLLGPLGCAGRGSSTDPAPCCRHHGAAPRDQAATPTSAPAVASDSAATPIDPSPTLRPEDELRARAESLWRARRDQNWAEVFEFRTPAERQDAKVEDFIEWSNKNEPFLIQSYEVGAVEVAEPLGWTQVKYTTRIRQFPNQPPRDAEQWQKWRRIDAVWYPVAPREAQGYPEPPSQRNAAEEARLRSRFADYWKARTARDYEKLIDLTDPADRPDLTVEQVRGIEEKIAFLDARIEWIEVIGTHGRMAVTYKHKLDDPSLTKAPPRETTLIERWILSDGEWYLDPKGS